MCGIAAFSLSPEDAASVDPCRLARCLLSALVVRGRDASGAAWTADGDVWFHKQPLPGPRYAPSLPMDPTTQTAILHTRAATNGDPADNVNNHPHSLPGVTGVHLSLIHI